MENANTIRHLANNSCTCIELEFRSSDYSPQDNFANINNKEYNSSNSRFSKSYKECEKIDRVSILGFYYKPLYHDCVVLIKQYRPHLRNYTIEMPTGLVENNESLEVSAVRILSEQTGYSGCVKTVGPPLADSPCSICQFSRIISMRIDGNDLRNSSVKSTYASDTTSSKILLVPIDELLDRLIVEKMESTKPASKEIEDEIKIMSFYRSLKKMLKLYNKEALVSIRDEQESLALIGR